MRLIEKFAAALFLCAIASLASGQEKSVRPGINDSFRDPNVPEFIGRFEVESREVYTRRKEILKACGIQPGQTVADIGAGTGLFTRMFSDAVGSEGRVIAVEISQKFLDHIVVKSREAGQKNVEALLCKENSTELPAASVDVAFICDTYHHFEFPQKTMTSLLRALKPGGRVVLIDFRREEGKSSDFVMQHVRAGQEVFEDEIRKAGFRKISENRDVLAENYFVVFEADPPTKKSPKLEFPIIAGYGGAVARPKAVDQPRAGAKVVFDATVDSKPNDVNKSLDRAARLLNLYGTAGLKASDVKITIVLHGDATKAVLTSEAYRSRFEAKENPNLPLIRALQAAGVEVLVCGQALSYKGFADDEVAEGIRIAVAALTVIMNRQADGYAYVPVP